MKEIIEMLQMADWYDGDEFIQIAKGKYQLPSTVKEFKVKIKRMINTKKK